MNIGNMSTQLQVIPNLVYSLYNLAKSIVDPFSGRKNFVAINYFKASQYQTLYAFVFIV